MDQQQATRPAMLRPALWVALGISLIGNVWVQTVNAVAGIALGVVVVLCVAALFATRRHGRRPEE